MRTHIGVDDLSRCILDVQQRRSCFELIYKTHSRWPLPPSIPSSGKLGYENGGMSQYPQPIKMNTQVPNQNDEDNFRISNSIKIAVLDSSFNPPTLAHLALANSSLPSALIADDESSSQHTYDTEDEIDRQKYGWNGDYDARLLLLSVRNVDKALKPGDATYEQRLEMMTLLAQELEASDTSPSSNSKFNNNSKAKNVAVGIIDEPTFVRKSSVLRSSLQKQLSSLLLSSRDNSEVESGSQLSSLLTKGIIIPDIQLYFLMGTDTLERFLAPRYYTTTAASMDEATIAMHTALRGFFSLPTEGGDGSVVICAGRDPSSAPTMTNSATTFSTLATAQSTVSASQTTSQSLSLMALAEPFISSGVLKFIDLTPFEKTISSSKVREKRREKDDEWTLMVSSSIRNYIEEKALYSAQTF